jgi:hypothetical protein
VFYLGGLLGGTRRFYLAKKAAVGPGGDGEAGFPGGVAGGGEVGVGDLEVEDAVAR